MLLADCLSGVRIGIRNVETFKRGKAETGANGVSCALNFLSRVFLNFFYRPAPRTPKLRPLFACTSVQFCRQAGLALPSWHSQSWLCAFSQSRLLTLVRATVHAATVALHPPVPFPNRHSERSRPTPFPFPFASCKRVSPRSEESLFVLVFGVSIVACLQSRPFRSFKPLRWSLPRPASGFPSPHRLRRAAA